MQTQTKTRNYVALAARSRNGGPMEKRGKGRCKKQQHSRQEIKRRIRGEL